jgi:hypothetical protein
VPFFAFSVVTAMGVSWQFAMMAVFVEGLVFLACTLLPVREKIFNAIPAPLKTAIGVGIGFLIIFIGLQWARIIVPGPCLTALVGFRANFGTSGICAVLALAGLLATVAMHRYKIRGAMLWGILFTWGLGMLCQALGVYKANPAQGMYSLYPTLKLSAVGGAFREFGTLCGACLDVGKWSLRGSELSGWKLLLSGNFLVVMFTLLFDDLFNTLGTLTGVAGTANMLDEEGKLPRLKGGAPRGCAGDDRRGADRGDDDHDLRGVRDRCFGRRPDRIELLCDGGAVSAGGRLRAGVHGDPAGRDGSGADHGRVLHGRADREDQLRRSGGGVPVLHGDSDNAVLVQHRGRHLLRLHLVDGAESALRQTRARQLGAARTVAALRRQIHIFVNG